MNRITEDEARLLPARLRQAEASNPADSAWVAANAGSGKTHVLVQRVVRLLLSGVAPSRILCLTFTKAAAANMAGRVFTLLSQWTGLDDGELAAAIEAMGHRVAGQDDLAFARRLFARAIETPGGLKIQTIHAFCERLLHLFPFEAGVAAGFRVAEEREAADMLAEAQQRALGASDDEAFAASVATLADETGKDGFEKLLREALRMRAELAAVGGQAPDEWRAALARRLGLAPGDSIASIEDSILAGLGGAAQWPARVAELREGSSKDQDIADHLDAALAATDAQSRLKAYFKVFFTEKGSERGAGKQKIITKTLILLRPGLLETLEAEQTRLIGLREALWAARIVERSAALVHVAARIFEIYEAEKARLGVLDFDDLIDRALALLDGPGSAWVLYKLDWGLYHVLVDEAQDTSEKQWRILDRLVDEFTAGAGARDARRTFFAVGDEKQSIFSFQGAAPAMFESKRRDMTQRHRAAERTLAHVPLTLSFRSAPIVLDAIDKVFNVPDTWRGVTAGEVSAPPHEARHARLPGLVELWAPVAGQKSEPDSSWLAPVDAPRANAPSAALARRIAKVVKGWLAPGSGASVHGRDGKVPRPMRAGDIMILVRRRNAFFEAMIRALKAEGVRTAGADRLKLKDHIAVMDLVAAGRAALARDDDLSLACVLKSPLIGLDDDALLALAPERGDASLAAAVAAAPRFADVAARLETWRERARRLSPFAFYAELLGAEGGRKALLGRLGAEAGDAIDEFLAAALEFERRAPASLTLFLAAIENDDEEIKRDMEAQGDSVRVMTIHAAKGLEASVVILADTCFGLSPSHDPKLFALDDPGGALIGWSPRAKEDSAALAEARLAARNAAAGEHRRLLYVALSRAAERLVAAGYHGVKGPEKDHWLGMIEAGLAPHLQPAPAPWEGGETIRRMGAAPVAAAGGEAPAAFVPAPAPAWLAEAAAPESASPTLRAAPAAGRAALAASPERRAAIEAGRLAHALLQHLPDLPPAARRNAARRFLAAQAPDIQPEVAERLIRQTLGVLDHPDLAPLFGPRSRAEAAVAAKLPGPDGVPAAFSGRVDRLAETPDAVWLADFKTGAPGGALAGDYAAQLALYRAALAPLYPGRRIRALLIWLQGPQIVEID